MKKNILLIGASRSGKTTLSRKINKELGYSIICLDDIISGFSKAFPTLGIRHNDDDIQVAERFSPFLEAYLTKLSEGSNFYNDCKFVIEGVFIDFDTIINKIDKEKYMIIGLTYNHINEKTLFDKIKANDTEDDWTYWCEEEELKGNVKHFIDNNKHFNDKFNEYNIKTYDVSKNREEVLEQIIIEIKNMV